MLLVLKNVSLEGEEQDERWQKKVDTEMIGNWGASILESDNGKTGLKSRIIMFPSKQRANEWQGSQERASLLQECGDWMKLEADEVFELDPERHLLNKAGPFILWKNILIVMSAIWTTLNFNKCVILPYFAVFMGKLSVPPALIMPIIFMLMQPLTTVFMVKVSVPIAMNMAKPFLAKESISQCGLNIVCYFAYYMFILAAFVVLSENHLPLVFLVAPVVAMIFLWYADVAESVDRLTTGLGDLESQVHRLTTRLQEREQGKIPKLTSIPEFSSSNVKLVLVKRVEKSQITQFQNWQKQMDDAISKAPGFRGEVKPENDVGHIEKSGDPLYGFSYRVVFFNSSQNALKWKESTERRQLLDAAQGFHNLVEDEMTSMDADMWGVKPAAAAGPPWYKLVTIGSCNIYTGLLFMRDGVWNVYVLKLGPWTNEFYYFLFVFLVVIVMCSFVGKLGMEIGKRYLLPKEAGLCVYACYVVYTLSMLAFSYWIEEIIRSPRLMLCVPVALIALDLMWKQKSTLRGYFRCERCGRSRRSS